MRVFVLLGILVLTACGSRTSPAQTIARCQQSAYAQIGVQSDANASLEYARNKHELVRACAVSAGLRFRSNAWASYQFKLREQVYRKYDIWTETPGSPKYQRVIADADAEIERLTATAMTGSEFWE